MNSHPDYIRALNAERLRAVREVAEIARLASAGTSDPVADLEPSRRRERIRWRVTGTSRLIGRVRTRNAA